MAKQGYRLILENENTSRRKYIRQQTSLWTHKLDLGFTKCTRQKQVQDRSSNQKSRARFALERTAGIEAGWLLIATSCKDSEAMIDDEPRLQMPCFLGLKA